MEAVQPPDGSAGAVLSISTNVSMSACCIFSDSTVGDEDEERMGPSLADNISGKCVTVYCDTNSPRLECPSNTPNNR